MSPVIFTEYAICVVYILFIVYSMLFTAQAEDKPSDTVGYILFFHGLVWMVLLPMAFIVIAIKGFVL